MDGREMYFGRQLKRRVFEFPFNKFGESRFFEERRRGKEHRLSSGGQSQPGKSSRRRSRAAPGGQHFFPAPRYFEWISHRAAAKLRQRLTFSAPEGRQRGGFAASLSLEFKFKRKPSLSDFNLNYQLKLPAKPACCRPSGAEKVNRCLSFVAMRFSRRACCQCGSGASSAHDATSLFAELDMYYLFKFLRNIKLFNYLALSHLSCTVEPVCIPALPSKQIHRPKVARPKAVQA
jgi:hypothetical protein